MSTGSDWKGKSYAEGAVEYLKGSGVYVDDPYAVPGLRPLTRSKNIPKTAAFEAYYKTEGEKIFCHLCAGHRHQQGVVGRLEDGTAILFGSKCARDYFGNDVWSTIEKKQSKNISDRNQEFRGIWIAKNISSTSEWIDSNAHLLNSLQDAWSNLLNKYPKQLKELFAELRRNRGRLVETEDQAPSRAAIEAGMSPRHFTVTNFILSVPYWDIENKISTLDNEITAVRLLCRNVLSTEDPTVEDFARWDSFLSSNIRHGAENIDDFIEHSLALFAPGALEVCGGWLDRRRMERLSEVDRPTPRDMGRMLRSSIGYGYERPTGKLADALPDFSLGRTIGRKRFSIIS